MQLLTVLLSIIQDPLQDTHEDELLYNTKYTKSWLY